METKTGSWKLTGSAAGLEGEGMGVRRRGGQGRGSEIVSEIASCVEMRRWQMVSSWSLNTNESKVPRFQ